MKKTGELCKIDALGRLVIPVRLRRSLELDQNDTLEIFMGDDNEIVLKRYIPKCVFCGSEDGLTSFKSKYVCTNCAKELVK